MPSERVIKHPVNTRAPRFLPQNGAGTEPAKFRTMGRAAPPPQAPVAPSNGNKAEVPAAEGNGIERLNMAIELLKSQAARLAEQARSDALEIGFQVAHRILETEVRTSTEPLLALIRSGIQKAGDSRRIVVKVNPQDATRLPPNVEALGVPGVNVAKIEIVADPALGPGDCLVDTDFGTVDGRLATRLQEMHRAVLDAEGDVA